MAVQKWEYLKTYSPSERDLDRIGEDGWELVSVVKGSHGSMDTYVFKRPKEQK